MTAQLDTKPLSVAIVGAGFAGIGAAIRLHDHGITDYAIFERSSRVGGTWRDNTYPGAACDIPSRLYSYSFAPNSDWSHTYSSSDEILRYIETLVSSRGLTARIRFDHTVTALTYDEDAGCWTVSLDGRAAVRARTVILASGPLSNASLPAITGIDDYQGRKIHSARWDHDFDFTSKKVAVIGTGASAVQIVPRLVQIARSVKVFQRTPGWVLPKINNSTPGWVKQLYADLPVTQRLSRSTWFWGHESIALGVVWDTPVTRLVEAVSKANLRLQVKDPWMRRQLTPDFAAGCKRLLMTSDFYPALQAPNCTLVTWPIARLSPHGIRTVEGIEHRFDAIVFATGFDISKTGTPIPVTGVQSRDLASEWRKGAYAYRSVAVSGYPNLFFTLGPNSGPGHSSALVYLEAQIDYIVDAISTLMQRGWKSLDVRPETQRHYNDRMQRRLRSTTWNSGCQSWYLTDDGFNATMYPGFATQYVNQLKTFNPEHYFVTTHTHRSSSAQAESVSTNSLRK